MSIVDKYGDALKAIAAGEKIAKYTIAERCGSERGDGYLGDLQLIEIVGDGKTLRLIMKKASDNVALRNQIQLRSIFLNEILFYEEIYPMFDGIQADLAVGNRFAGIPRCYLTSTEDVEEFLLFEDLKQAGFTMWNRKVTMDRAHVEHALKNYAKFHALSFAARQLHPERFSMLTSRLYNIYDTFLEDQVKIDAFQGIIDKVKVKVAVTIADEDVNARFANYCDTSFDFLDELIKYDDEFGVLLHGDAWCNNMMFKYDNKNPTVPIDMRIIDWQILKIGPCILDLVHFLYVCTSKQIYDDMPSLLRLYHTEMQTFMTALNIALPMSYDDLLQLWRTYGKYGLMMCFVTLKIMLSDSDEAPSLKETADTGEEAFRAFDFETKHDQIYQRRLNDVVMHCYEQRLI